MKRFWPVMLVVFMLCFGFGGVAYAADTNPNTPAYETPVPGMADFSTMPESIVISYDVLPGAYRSDGGWLPCCAYNPYPRIKGKSYSDGVRYIAYTKSRLTNLRT